MTKRWPLFLPVHFLFPVSYLIPGRVSLHLKSSSQNSANQMFLLLFSRDLEEKYWSNPEVRQNLNYKKKKCTYCLIHDIMKQKSTSVWCLSFKCLINSLYWLVIAYHQWRLFWGEWWQLLQPHPLGPGWESSLPPNYPSPQTGNDLSDWPFLLPLRLVCKKNHQFVFPLSITAVVMVKWYQSLLVEIGHLLDIILICENDDTTSIRCLHHPLDNFVKLSWFGLSGNLNGLSNTQPSYITHAE